MLDLARPDWEEELSRQVGDVAAHQIGNAARHFVRWARESAETLSRDRMSQPDREQRQRIVDVYADLLLAEAAFDVVAGRPEAAGAGCPRSAAQGEE